MLPYDVAVNACLAHGAVQKPNELAIFLKLVSDINPEVIVEIGSYAGGTLYAWRQYAKIVVGIDLPAASTFSSTGKPRESHGTLSILADSHKQSTLEHLQAILGGRRIDVLFIDGDHSYEGVRRDYCMYAPLVRPGGLIGFHDVREHPPLDEIEVPKFWAEIKDDTATEIITGEDEWGGIGVLHVPGN